MKNHLLIALSLIALTISVSCSSSGYNITGDVSGLEGKVYLAVMQGKNPNFIDSTEANNGKFTFKGKTQTPLLAAVVTSDKKRGINFFIENSEITISGDITQPQDIQITGSKEEEIHSNFIEKTAIAESEDDYFSVIDEVIDANPGSVAAAYIFFRNKVPMLTQTEMREGIAKFDPSIQDVVYLKLVGDLADKMDSVAVGKKFTEIEMPDLDGNSIKLSDIVAANRYTLLDFWASWCPPCRAENPNLVANYRKFAEKGFTIFGVSLDSEKQSWIDAIAKDSLTWTHVSDINLWTSEAVTDYAVGSIPTNLLISQDGTILARNIRGAELGKELERLMPSEQ